MNALRVLTNSELKTRRRCAREHHLRYNEGLCPIEDVEALRFGDHGHQALEVWWRWHQEHAERPGYDFASEEPQQFALALLDNIEMDPFARVKLEELLRGYHYRWSMAMGNYEVLAVEVQFRAPIINPETGAASRTFEQGGKIDVLLRERSSGLVFVLDHKFTSEDISSGSTYWRALRLDSQVSTYFSGAESLGHRPAAWLHDVIAKPTIRPSKATPPESRQYTQAKYKQCPACKKKDGTASAPHTLEGCVGPCEVDPEGGPRRICTDAGGRLYANMRESDETPEEFRARLRESIAAEPERYYRREPVVRLEEDLRDHAYDIWAISRAIREDELAQRAPKNPDACRRYGRTCGFFDACTQAASLDDPTRFERLDNVHQELAAPAA